MASGVTLKLRDLSRQMAWRVLEEREPVERDRSLRGKARIKQRKADNKAK